METRTGIALASRRSTTCPGPVDGASGSSRRNARRRKVMARAMGFGMRPVLQRYALLNQVSLEEADLLERELKRYLVLRALRPRKRYGITGPVDQLWHVF